MPFVNLPNPPANYTVPLGAIGVSDVAELETALANPAPSDIVLADGIYEAATYFTNSRGHRLYAESLGGAVLRSGLFIGSPSLGAENPVVQGLAFDVSDPAKEPTNLGIIHIWGSATGARLADLTFEGNNAAHAAIVVRKPDGISLSRIVAGNFQSFGVLVDSNVLGSTLNIPATLEDIDVFHVTRPVPKSANGTAEAGIWVGDQAYGNRLRMRDCAWMGLWTGTSSDRSRFADLDIDEIADGTGIYAEHFTTNTIFERMRIGPSVKNGVICEWADPSWGGVPACDNVIFQDGVINSTFVGVYMDKGTRRTTVRRMKFQNQSGFAIGNYLGVGNLWDTTGNDMSEVPGISIYTGHINSI